MVRQSDNLLTTLHTYAHHQDENFTTAAFAHLVRYLQGHEEQEASKLIEAVTDGLLTVPAEEIRKLTVTTQCHFDTGTPDILISSPEYFVFVEVKVESDLGWNQIDKYLKLLDARSEHHRYLVLLSRYSVDFGEGAKPCRHVRWHRIARVIQENLTEVSDAVSSFLMTQFLHFLEENGMAMERVGWELVQGVQSLVSLMNIVEDALAATKADKVQKQAGADWNGFDFCIDKTWCWCGLMYSNPQALLIEAYDISESAKSIGSGRYLDKREIDYGRYHKQSSSKWRSKLELDSEDVHFFSLSPDRQQEVVEKFVAESVSAVKEMSPLTAVAKEAAPASGNGA